MSACDSLLTSIGVTCPPLAGARGGLNTYHDNAKHKTDKISGKIFNTRHLVTVKSLTHVTSSGDADHTARGLFFDNLLI